MRRWGLVAALLFLVVTNAVLWARLAYNRAGEPEGTVVLTGREVSFEAGWRNLEGKKGRPISVSLRWNPDYTPWFDQAKLEALGFDLSLPPSMVGSENSYYRRLLPRKVYVGLEYDGQGYAAWRREMTEKIARMEERDREGKLEKWEKEELKNYKSLLAPSSSQSRLFALDADLNPAALRRRYPDRQGFIILAAEVRAAYGTTWDEVTIKSGPPRIKGVIKQLLVNPIFISSRQQDLLEEINRHPTIYRPLRPVWERVGPKPEQLEEIRRKPIITIPILQKRDFLRFTICVGKSYEPWVADIRFLEEAK